MKNNQIKFIIILTIALMLLVGSSYLLLSGIGAQQKKTEPEPPGVTELRPGYTPPEEPVKPPPPEHQLPSVVATAPGTPPSGTSQEPEHQLPSLVVSKPSLPKEPIHEDSDVPLYEGPPKATGDDCTDPIVVNLPGNLPYSDLSQTNCGRGNSYDATCLGSYDGGEDIIYELNVTSAVDVDITMDPKGTTWTGMAVDDACPLDASTCLYKTTASSGSLVLTGVHLDPGTYYIMIDTWPTPNCIPDFDLTIIEAAPPPPNDDCANAEAVGDVTDLAWSTTLATFDGSGTCMTSPNIWYCYTATCDGDVTVSLCGSEFDTKLAVYEGCSCDPLGTEIECNDDCCGTRSQITFAATTGSQYLIEVGGYSSNTGDGVLNISCHTPGPPPANDECENAIALSPPDCPDVQTVSGTTKDATVDCPGVLDWEAVWYEFELPYTWNKVYIDYCPTNYEWIDTRGVVLYDECPVDCENYILYTDLSWVTCTSGYTDLTVWWENLPAGTYYLPVYVVDCSGNQLDFSFDICIEELAGPEPGDNCEYPIAASLNKGEGDTLYMDLGQTTCGRGDDYDATCLGYYDGGEDIIYELTVSTAVRVDITLDPKTTTYTGIAIDDACPPGATCMAYHTSSSAVPHGFTSLDLDPGTYYIMIDTWPSPDCIPDFDLVITEVGVGPDNDECTGAPVISSFPQTVYGTTSGAGSDCPDVLYDPYWNAVWYRFDLPYECNDLYVDFCPTTDSIWTVGVILYDECPPDCPNYILRTGYQWTDPCPNGYMNPQIWWDNLPGPASYWFPVAVWDESDNPFMDFGFEVSVTECPPPEPGDNCSYPIAVAVPGDLPYTDASQTTCDRGNNYSSTCLGYYDGGEDIIYELTVTSSVDVDIMLNPKGTTYTGLALADECPPGATCIDYSTNSGSDSHGLYAVHLDPGTYYIMIDTWPSPDCIPDFDLTITESAGPPANDDCANAEAVGDVTDLAFSTLSATFDGLGSCMTSPNIWYCYTATCEGNVTVSLCGSDYDTKLAVYEGCTCDPLGTEIGCNDDYCGLQSQITFSAVMGNQYLIEVGGYSSNTGNGILNISCAIPPDNDECEGAPITTTFPDTIFGSNEGAGVDCPGVLDWNSTWYRFDLPYECNQVTVDFCQTDGEIYTVGVVLYDECPPDCPNYIVRSSIQWPICESGYQNPVACWNNLPGPASYWFPVFALDSNDDPIDFGFEVSVQECPLGTSCDLPIVVELPADMPYLDRDQTNCCLGDVYSETCLGYYDGGEDIIYQLNVTENVAVEVMLDPKGTTWTGILLDDSCPPDASTCLYTSTNSGGDSHGFQVSLTPGTYYIMIDTWPSPYCIPDYDLTIDPLGPEISVTPGSMYPLLNPDATVDEHLYITNEGYDALDYEISEDPEVAWMSLTPTSGSVASGMTDDVTVTFDATGLGPGDYYSDLVITSNALYNPEVTIPVHLEVELPPDIDVITTMSVGVLPGCYMAKGLRVDNFGTGELRYDISVSANPPGKLADVLLVDDDNSAVYPADFADSRTYFTDALDANGYTYDIFEVTVEGADGPDATTMADYPVVIWFTGEAWRYDQTLTANDEVNLATYLDGGGNLFLSSQDYFYDRYYSYDPGSFSPGQFPYDYLGVTWTDQDTVWLTYPESGTVTGMPGSVAEGMVFDLFDLYTEKDGLCIDAITHMGTDLFEITSPEPAGICACQYEVEKGFRVVFTTVDFAGLVDDVSPSTRAELMGNIMDWLLGGGCPITVDPDYGTIPPESFFDVVLNFDGTAFEPCVDETMTCYLVISSNDPDEPEVTVQVDMWSGRGDVFEPVCEVDVSDVVYLINYVLKDGPAPDPECMGDCNPPHDGGVDLEDVTYVIQYLFQFGPPPKAAPEVGKTAPSKLTPIERK